MVEIVERIQPPANQQNVLTPAHMLHTALTQGADIAILEKLMALQERYEASQARKAFDSAMADAKAHMGTVHKTTKGNYGNYADFASVARHVDPVLSEHGLSYRFNVDQTERSMKVTCIVRHRDGHYEETTLMSPVDTSGSKNAVQQIGSTQTYLQRYTLMAALGLAASKDDDGQSAGNTSIKAITNKQLADMQDLLVQTKTNIAMFLDFVKVESLEDFSQQGADAAIAMLKRKLTAQGGRNA